MNEQHLHVVLGAAAELASRGHRVRHVSRGEIPQVDDRIERVRADVATPEGAIAATEGAAVIYHAVNVAYHLQVATLPGVTEAIIEAASTHDARLVVLDTLYPYGTADGEAVTERTPWAATSRKGRMRARLDARYLEAHESGEARTVLARAADFFGPGVFNATFGGAFFPGAITGGPALAIGDLTLPHSFTYIKDVARGLATLGADDKGDGRVWHLPTNPAVPTAELHRVIESITGRPLAIELITEAVPYGPFDAQFMSEFAEMFYQYEIPQNMVSAAFESAFGVRPTPMRQALEETVAWFETVLSEPR
jgi:nucleoside-diphosphate-sugar epimerase